MRSPVRALLIFNPLRLRWSVLPLEDSAGTPKSSHARPSTTIPTLSIRRSATCPSYPASVLAAGLRHQAEVAPGSHGGAKRGDARSFPRPASPHHDTESRMSRPPPHVHCKECHEEGPPAERCSTRPRKTKG